MTTGFSRLFSIDGKYALVTGGSRGIGEMIAAGFLASGCRVYISSRKAGVGFGGETEGVDWASVGANSPLGRMGGAEDIAGLAIFLCSRAGAYVVGETICCDGGLINTR